MSRSVLMCSKDVGKCAIMLNVMTCNNDELKPCLYERRWFRDKIYPLYVILLFHFCLIFSACILSSWSYHITKYIIVKLTRKKGNKTYQPLRHLTFTRFAIISWSKGEEKNKPNRSGEKGYCNVCIISQMALNPR